MRLIPLTQGQYAIVDDWQYDRVMERGSWYYEAETGYAARKEYVRGSGKAGQRGVKVYLHRFVLNAPAGVQVDHRNRNPLDCREDNLRLATNAQNNANKPKLRGKSRYKGVTRRRDDKAWQAAITVNYKSVSLGTRYQVEEDAARAYDRAALRFFGEFARTNFPREDYE